MKTGTIYTVADYLQSANGQLKYWEKEMEKLNNGTLQYDGSIPNSCYNALIKKKVKLYTSVVDWLNTFDKNEVVGDNIGLTKLGAEYYKRVNA